jgi:hypothetical protein
MNDSGSTYGSRRTANVVSLPLNASVDSNLIGLLSILSILILLLLSEGNILLGIIS